MGVPDNPKFFRFFLVALALLFFADLTMAGPLRDRIAERRAAQHTEAQEDADEPASVAPALPLGATLQRDVAYGPDKVQRFDVYLPRQPKNAPVILMLHGGGWKKGDKANRSVVENKVPHWLAKGYIFISANYRLLPQAGPVEQADDVARALAIAQRNAALWGGDSSTFILMGHSAGAHLVALLSASPEKAYRHGASPWRGTVLLDSAALDVVKIMAQPHASLYDDAFGSDPGYWERASPYHQLSSRAVPMLAVCSTRRGAACPQAHDFAAKAHRMGVRAEVTPQALTHREVNLLLGKESSFTETVDIFLQSLLHGSR